MSQFEGDCCSAERLEGVRAVWLRGIENGNGFRDTGHVVGKMMVRDDQVYAQGSGLSGRGESANTSINTDDETDAGGGGLSQDGGLHAIAFAEAVGDVV